MKDIHEFFDSFCNLFISLKLFQNKFLKMFSLVSLNIFLHHYSGLNSIPPKSMSSCNLRMRPYLEIWSLQISLRRELRVGPGIILTEDIHREIGQWRKGSYKSDRNAGNYPELESSRKDLPPRLQAAHGPAINHWVCRSLLQHPGKQCSGPHPSIQ